MRIGFSSIYAWRPHTEHLHYLAELVRKAGHEVEFFACDADLPTCYTRELRDRLPDWAECLLCRAGGIRSFESDNISFIGEYNSRNNPLPEDWKSWALPVASTLGRFESEEDFNSPEFLRLVQRLEPVVEITYQAAYEWIKKRKLDAVVVFNARMETTRAIFEAGKSVGIAVASMERTWFGDGLQILPGETCLGLKTVGRIVSEWSDRPLTKRQALKAVGYVASRYLRRNNNEWRAYNVNAENKAWPSVLGRHKILLIPGSLNEVWGHSDWSSSWKHPTDAYDALIDQFSLSPADLVLRCHPNWNEKIGKADGHMPEDFYTAWAKKRGIMYIPSADTTSTLGLIEQADAVVVSGGTAAIDAGILGKQIIAVGPSSYQEAKICDSALDMHELTSLKLMTSLDRAERIEIAVLVRRRTLRFLYTIANRIPLYSEYVKCLSPTKYTYKDGANGELFIDLLITGKLVPKDDEFSESEAGEDEILKIAEELRWEELIENSTKEIEYRHIRRRFPYAAMDSVRELMRHGDR